MIGSQGYMLVPAIGPGIALPLALHHTLTGSVYTNITELIDTVAHPATCFQPATSASRRSFLLVRLAPAGRDGVSRSFSSPSWRNWISTL